MSPVILSVILEAQVLSGLMTGAVLPVASVPWASFVMRGMVVMAVMLGMVVMAIGKPCLPPTKISGTKVC
jgi:hypothetical protein